MAVAFDFREGEGEGGVMVKKHGNPNLNLHVATALYTLS